MSRQDHNRRLRIALEAVLINKNNIGEVFETVSFHLDNYMEQIKADLPDEILFDFKNRIEKAATLLGVDKDKLTKAAANYPRLFFTSPEKMDDNAKEIAKCIGTTKAKLLPIMLSDPKLFYEKAEKINNKLTQNAAIIGAAKKEFVAAILKHKAPMRSYQCPEKTRNNVEYIRAAHANGYIKSKDISRSLLNHHTVLGIAPRNTHLRCIDAHITKEAPSSLTSFFARTTKKEIEERVIKHYTDMFNKTGKGQRTLQILAEARIISKLPDWCEKPENPLRNRNRNEPALT